MEANKDKRSSPKSIRFPEEIERKIEAKAKKMDRSFSWVVINIVKEYFKKK